MHRKKLKIKIRLILRQKLLAVILPVKTTVKLDVNIIITSNFALNLADSSFLQCDNIFQSKLYRRLTALVDHLVIIEKESDILP